jgi:branched-chain amino acid transport system permease protein
METAASLLSGQLLLAAVVTSAMYALTATGLNLVYGTLRLLNVAHGDLVMIGAYIGFWCFALFNLSPLVSMWLAMLVGALLGVLLYRWVFVRVIRNRRLSERLEANSLLIFFGISVVIQNLASIAFSNNYRAYQYMDHIVRWMNVSIAANRLVAVLVATLFLAALLYVLRHTVLGLGLRALMQDRDASALVGVNLRLLYSFSFAVGFGLATLGGALISMYEQVQPFMGLAFGISAFVVIMLGGLGDVTGGLYASAILGVIETYGLVVVGASYRSLLLYGVFVLLLIVRPQGLFRPRGAA